ncbi:MAG: protein-L-isoaspartate O-methyltransferase [Armatimonadota bacterium]
MPQLRRRQTHHRRHANPRALPRRLSYAVCSEREELLRRVALVAPSNEALLEAFRRVPREEFVPPEWRNRAWSDQALPLAEGSTISQPSMIAIMLDTLDVSPGMRAVEVGSGSGYVLALLEELGVEAVGVEIIPHVANRSLLTLRRLKYKADVLQGNAAEMEWNEKFDRVLFSAAVEEVPQWSLDLLKEGGFVLAPVGDRSSQELVRAYRDRTERTRQYCRFVPFQP